MVATELWKESSFSFPNSEDDLNYFLNTSIALRACSISIRNLCFFSVPEIFNCSWSYLSKTPKAKV